MLGVLRWQGFERQVEIPEPAPGYFLVPLPGPLLSAEDSDFSLVVFGSGWRFRRSSSASAEPVIYEADEPPWEQQIRAALSIARQHAERAAAKMIEVVRELAPGEAREGR